MVYFLLKIADASAVAPLALVTHWLGPGGPPGNTNSYADDIQSFPLPLPTYSFLSFHPSYMSSRASSRRLSQWITWMTGSHPPRISPFLPFPVFDFLIFPIPYFNSNHRSGWNWSPHSVFYTPLVLSSIGLLLSTCFPQILLYWLLLPLILSFITLFFSSSPACYELLHLLPAATLIFISISKGGHTRSK